jgi:DNA repair protein SbcC/Rad50
MKPLLLKIQAFGPYAGKEQIDFRHIASGGLFLIHGQTGAGKTSILDAICFALFSTSSGADRQSDGLRSDLADASLPTEVTLEFSLGPDLYKVVRRPRQTLKKQRGEGFTTSNPTGELFQLEGENTWRPLASGEKPSSKMLTDLLGMNEEQFRQVVVLPQGQFRKFLSASSDEREKLLQKLFRTEKFSELSALLQMKANLVSTSLKEMRLSIESKLSFANVQTSAELDAQIKNQQDSLREADTQQAAIAQTLRAATERAELARQYDKNLKEKAVLATTQMQLEEKKAEIELLRKKLEDERRAQPVLQIDRSATVVENDVLRLQKEVDAESVRLTQFQEASSKISEEKERHLERQPEIENMKVEAQKLRELWTSAKRLQTEQEKLREKQDLLQKAIHRAGELETQQKHARESVQQLQKSLQEVSARTLEKASLENEHQLLTNELNYLQKALENLSSIKTKMDEVSRQKLALQSQLKKQNDDLLATKLRFHLSQAALLARELKADQPCPVCGSKTHPSPAAAHSHQDSVTPEQLEAAESELRKSAEALARLEAQLEAQTESANSEKKRIQETLRDNLKPEERAAQIAARLSELNKGLAEAKSLIEQKKQLDLRLQTIEKNLADLDKEILTAGQTREDARTAAGAAHATVDELSAQVPENLRDVQLISEKGLQLKGTIESYTLQLERLHREADEKIRLKTASESNLDLLKKQLVEKSKAFSDLASQRAQLLRDSGFADLETCRLAALHVNDVADFEKRIRAYFDQQAATISRLKTLEQTIQTTPDFSHQLEAREEELKIATMASNDAREKLATLKETNRNLQALLSQVSILENESKGLEESYAVLGRIAGIASGQPPFNSARINFSRFVLAARLDDVLDQASRRLFIMSRGQFTLKRALAQEDKRRSAGLDLVVEDSYSGTARPTASLSGGEGFLASLCLALGLADVVQSEIGGTRIEAVFVDEGFGTLDPEALQLAMEALTQLTQTQSGGRMVGVISHVSEMKQIAHRLVVRKTPAGSHVSWANHE